MSATHNLDSASPAMPLESLTQSFDHKLVLHNESYLSFLA